MENKRDGALSIRTDGDRSEVRISWSNNDILFNWVALTHQVCKSLNVSPILLAASMPGAIADYLTHDFNYETRSSGEEGQQHGGQ